ncbi:acetylornithine deacetylase/succinyl-diaminopimelate desuccinylase-like protein [Halospina denitrificans]|uniref:Acetylornithine deacetylase/succinyl-diaminopimelate desuccinylase-like protein n=1 Tax=Halospina denitrificans TaxID=332522 RepID=A0A4R7JKR6_9GAMM|nr:M20/M25/M40 family metallo-hydrolase [Halospina denitrificans]TDT38601.1 acetylornithine deacetylase/succinyl-diaminopimelate desuccinylase-like protein [Halospina denitrificans]
MLEPVLRHIDNGLEESIGRWSELLRIPSVSTDPAYEPSMRKAAQWLQDQLAPLGFNVDIRETEGHPVVIGHHPGPGGDATHVLYYGHYDVQPPDPLEEWDNEPFEPTLVDGPHGRRMVARGAVDDKGQLMMWFEALRAWHAEHGDLPVAVTVLLEGEEEVGSRNLRPVLERYRDELAADVCVVSDTAMWDIDTPALTYTLRGLLYTELTCRGPGHDLHSGFYGGAVCNPLNALSRVLGALQDDSGRIRIPGFYDDVVEPSEEELSDWRSLNMDEEGFLASAGLSTSGGGETDRSLLERTWSRPSCDINGIIGGFTGAGAKTVIPREASAKVSFRLVPDQDPERVIEAFRQFIDDNTPAGCTIDLRIDSAAPAIRIPTTSPYLRAAKKALGSVYDREALLLGCGGSIPIAAWARDILGIDTLLMGFSLADDGMHSPNEKFEVTCFHRGIRAHAALLEELRQQ